jgi:hypothetical protein
MHIIETAYPIVEKLALTIFRFSPISGQMFFLAMADYNFTNKQKLQMVYKWYTNGIQMVYKWYTNGIQMRGARKLTGENLKPVWAEFSTIS